MINLKNEVAPINIEPKIYAIVLFDAEGTPRKQWLGMSYSFEGALDGARSTAKADFPAEAMNIDFWKPILFSSISLEEVGEMIEDIQKANKMINESHKKKSKIISNVKSISIDEVGELADKKTKKKDQPGEPSKNQLMKKILKTKDVWLLKKSRKELSKVEFNYLVDKIAPNGGVRRK